ncbi:NAD(P)H-hydrate dehydratase [bacterium]|nr:NAD(P)H-hydrate dehydratase [bacterium]
MRLVDSKQMQEMDRYTIEEVGIPGLVLMENAAKSWVVEAEVQLKKAESIYIFCGAGNNGGDGYAIARNLANKGYECIVIAVKPPKSPDCKKNADVWTHYGKTLTWEDYKNRGFQVNKNDILIDAVLGTGIESNIKGELIKDLSDIDSLPGVKMAVDLPSGVNASTGDIMGAGIKADYTITFQKEKIGHHLYPGRKYTGDLKCAKISIIERYTDGDRQYYLITKDLVKPFLPIRNPDSFKNQYGHLATWCGSPGTLGAALMSSHAALKTGVGLVTSALPAQNTIDLLSQAPELMSFPQEKIDTPWIDQFEALVVGCGLGRDKKKWAAIESMLSKVDIPLLLDADAFYGIKSLASLNLKKTVLTPHPGEFAKLSGFAKPVNNKERLEQGIEFVDKFRTTLVLKGSPTIVFGEDGNAFINSTGNSGMATAGSGDVLSGIIGGFLAQGLSPINASLLGTWLHGKSGDLYSLQHSEETLTATCLIDYLDMAIRHLQNKI